jgi:hypothetical protein
MMELGWAFRNAEKIFGTGYLGLYIGTASVQNTDIRDKVIHIPNINASFQKRRKDICW